MTNELNGLKAIRFKITLKQGCERHVYMLQIGRVTLCITEMSRHSLARPQFYFPGLRLERSPSGGVSSLKCFFRFYFLDFTVVCAFVFSLDS